MNNDGSADGKGAMATRPRASWKIDMKKMADWNQLSTELQDQVLTALEKQKIPNPVALFQPAQSASHRMCSPFWLKNMDVDCHPPDENIIAAAYLHRWTQHTTEGFPAKDDAAAWYKRQMERILSPKPPIAPAVQAAIDNAGRPAPRGVEQQARRHRYP